MLEVRGLHKSFGAVKALDDVNIHLHNGEILGLLGDNGAGKSTLVKCLSGILKPDAGRILLDGIEVNITGPEGARELGIEAVHQDLGLANNLSVAENLFLNRELVSPWPVLRQIGWLDGRKMNRRTEEVLSDLGIKVSSVRLSAARLSGGQRQAIAIGRGAAWGKHVVLMDEPAAALGVRQAEIVLDLMENLANQNVSVVFISHNVEHVLRVCHRSVVLRHGKVVANVTREEATLEGLVSLITGATAMHTPTTTLPDETRDQAGVVERQRPGGGEDEQ